MKNCPNCKAVVDDHFEVCWNCNYSFESEEIIEFKDVAQTGTRSLNCLRCDTEMHFSGNYKFHEGTRSGVLGVIGELLVNRESFDIYVCPNCGKVELYSPHIGI